MSARLIDFIEEILLRLRQPVFACAFSLRLSLRGDEQNQQSDRKAQRSESKQSNFHWGNSFHFTDAVQEWLWPHIRRAKTLSETTRAIINHFAGDTPTEAETRPSGRVPQDREI